MLRGHALAWLTLAALAALLSACGGAPPADGVFVSSLDTSFVPRPRLAQLMLGAEGAKASASFQGPEDIAGTAASHCVMLTGCSAAKAAALQAILLWSCPSGSPSSGTIHLAATGYPNQTEVFGMFSGCGANAIFATNLCDQDANNAGCAGAADFVQTGGNSLQFEITATCHGLSSSIGFCLDATSSAGRCYFTTSGGPATSASLLVVAYRYNIAGAGGSNSHNDGAVQNNGTGFGLYFNWGTAAQNFMKGGNLSSGTEIAESATSQPYPGWFRLLTVQTASATNLWVDGVNTNPNQTGVSVSAGTSRELFANATNCAGTSDSLPGIFAGYVLWGIDVSGSASALDGNIHSVDGI